MNNPQSPVISPDFKFQDYKAVFSRVVIQELSHRTTVDETQDIMRFVLSVGKEHKLHTMFTKTGIIGVQETVFLNQSVRDFVLCVADRFFIEISQDAEANTIHDSLINHISNGLIFYQKHELVDGRGNVSPFCYTPTEVLSNIMVDDVKQILKHNNWLIVTVMILMAYPDFCEEIGIVAKTSQ